MIKVVFKEKYSSNNTEDRSKFQEAGVTEVCQEAISVILVFDKVSTRAVAVKLERKARISKGILKKRKVWDLGYRSQKEKGIKDKSKLNRRWEVLTDVFFPHVC